jgi:ectoine hydroxylase-related dioxygenase (phytanoyl-CoA dioxygenase family)
MLDEARSSAKSAPGDADPALAALKTAYDRDGFVTVEGLLDAGEVETLRNEIAAVARGERGAIAGAEPADGRSDADLIADILAIHMPHKISPLIRATMAHPRIVPILQALISPNVKAMQTMVFVKRPGKPGQAWHQDEHYIATRDRSLCGAWIALDDAVIENGCMWMHPGSQASGVLWPIHPHGDDRFDGAEEAYGHGFDREGGVPVQVKAGGVAFFNGYVLHRSLPNRAEAGFRRALVTHYMSAESMLPWTLGTPRAKPDVRDIVMIAGEDPYAWRGTEEVLLPWVRPDNAKRQAEILAELAASRTTIQPAD